MKTLRIFPLISVLVISLFVGCSSDDDDKPDPIPGEKTTMTIGSSGGDITLNAFTLRVPAGAFQESHSLTITETNTGETGFEEVFSKTYEVEGVPGDYALPIEIGLISDTDLPEGSRFALQEEGFVTSLDTVVTKTRILNTEANAFEMWAVLDAPEDGLQSGESEAETREAGTLSFSLFGISSYASYTTADGQFEIHFPADQLDKVYTLAAHLSESYTQIENLGLSFDARTNWPLQVTVKNLAAGIFGYAGASLWGDNYGYMEINLMHLAKATELKTTVGHELMHIAQSLYDPRNAFSKAKFAAPHLWLDEAVSVWFERTISGDPNYVSPVFETAASTGLIGAHVAALSTYRADYGYAQAPFIQYIENRFGRDKIARFYDEIAKGESAFEAINQSLPRRISSFWHDYLDELLTFSIYESDGFGPSWIIGNAKQTIEMPSDPSSINGRMYGSSSPPLSGHLYFIKDNNTYDEMVKLKLKIDSTGPDQKIHAFKFNSQGAEHLGTDLDSVFVTNYNEIVEGGARILVVIASDHMIAPSNNFKPYQFNPIAYKAIPLGFLNFDLRLTGTYNITKPDTTYQLQNPVTLSNSSYYANHSGPISYGQNGNTALYSFSYDYFDFTITVNASFLFDDIDLPRTIEYFEIESVSVSSGSSGESRRATTVFGQDIPIADLNDGDYSYRLSGNVSGNIVNVSSTYNSTNSSGAVIRMDELISYDASDGDLRIWFRE